MNYQHEDLRAVKLSFGEVGSHFDERAGEPDECRRSLSASGELKACAGVETAG